MDDIRQKLFPIFLQETKRNLHVLRDFFAYKDLSKTSLEELEMAFRTAHTLKGTANLVQVESIIIISKRLEAMLEKHYTAQTVPTPVEHEAMKLAVDWLVLVLAALRENLPEPSLFIAEAVQALDLAAAYPGRTPLVELLDSQSQQRAPQLDDPFAGAPDLLADEPELLLNEQDPFADDPAFGLSQVIQPHDTAKTDQSSKPGMIADPFAAECDFYTTDQLLDVSGSPDAEEQTESLAPPDPIIPEDPFADDYDFINAEQVMDGPVFFDAVEKTENSETLDPAPAVDPFADDPLVLESDSFTAPVQRVTPVMAHSLSIGADEPALAGSPETEQAASLGMEDAAIVLAEQSAADELVSDVAVIADSTLSDGNFELSKTAITEDPFADDAVLDESSGIASAPIERLSTVAAVGETPLSLNQDADAERAEHISASLLLPQSESGSEARRDYVCCIFRIGERDYYLPIKQMLEITDLPRIMPLPLAPLMVSGLINLRGQVMPVINLSILNQHQQPEVRVQRRLVIAEYQNERLAFLADGVPSLAENFKGGKIDMAHFLSFYRIKGAEE